MIKIAIDANEANIAHRVGSNTYAFALLYELYKLTAKRQLQITILLSRARLPDLPTPRANWRYVYVSPRKFWTQWALPIHLFLHQKDYDVFFTFSHYAPRISSVPYLSCVMDLAFLDYPEQFRHNDRLQLTHWTRYSVQNARKIITISKFSKAEIIKHYHRQSKDVVVAYPACHFPQSAETGQSRQFLQKMGIKQPYFLYLGTLQPRKNIVGLIAAYEELLRKVAAHNLSAKRSRSESVADGPRAAAKGRKHKRLVAPQLVIAGKVGWLAEPILARVAQSVAKEQIILTDFVADKYKKALYQGALASLLLSFYEGFGIPPLDSISVGTLPIVASNSSLPEVVGAAGLLVDPRSSHQISDAMFEVLSAAPLQRQKWQTVMRRQSKKFSWAVSAKVILNHLEGVARDC